MSALTPALLRGAIVAAAVSLVAACVTTDQGKDCVPDNIAGVAGGGECLVLRTFGTAPDNRALIVFVHGDDNIPEGGRPRDYLAGLARGVSGDGATAVVLIRPGHHDYRNRASTTRGGRYRSDWFLHDTRAVSDAIARLKEHHGAERVVLVGHSIGGAIGRVILAKNPGLVDSAVLIACLCNWTPGVAGGLSTDLADVKVVALTGANDTVTPPRIARNYIAELAEQGVAATFIEVAGKGHDLVDHPQVREAINRFALSQ